MGGGRGGVQPREGSIFPRVWTVKGMKPETSVKGSDSLAEQDVPTCVCFIGGEVSGGILPFESGYLTGEQAVPGGSPEERGKVRDIDLPNRRLEKSPIAVMRQNITGKSTPRALT